MTTPRFREHPVSRRRRLGVGKIHIAWSKLFGEWIAYGEGPHAAEADRFAIDQDHRWTPRY